MCTYITAVKSGPVDSVIIIIIILFGFGFDPDSKRSSLVGSGAWCKKQPFLFKETDKVISIAIL
jgi:hypothetical protein